MTGVALGLAGAVVAADQLVKSAAVRGPVGSGAREHVFGPFGLSLGYNSGSAFSLFQGRSAALFVVAAGLVVVLGVAAFRTEHWLRGIALGLVVGGALGNLADRAWRGHGGSVVDFITLTHWPTFNLADSAITVGVVLLAGSLLRGR